MEEHISREVPLPATGRDESAAANPVQVEKVRRPRKTRARIVQIISLVVLVVLLILLWRFLGDKAATPKAGQLLVSTLQKASPKNLSEAKSLQEAGKEGKK